MDDIKDNVNSKLGQSMNIKYAVLVHDVIKAISHLKHGKSDGHEGLCSDSIINAPHS